MKIETVKIDELKPLEKNVRTHTPTQIKEIIRSYNQFGQTRPIVIDEKNTVLIGNGFYMALKQLGKESVEAYRIKGLSEIQKKKLILSDNRTFSLGLDNFDGIDNYINDIVQSGDFDVAGYDEETLKEMTRTLDEVTKDVASQGTIDNEVIQNMNNAFTKSIEKSESEPLPQSNNATVQSSQTHEESPFVETKPNIEKTIICPNCGEIIHFA